MEKAKVITLKELFSISKLTIPKYQRPYKWNIKNVNQIIDDILKFSDKKAYRFGTIILHKDSESNTINIVDGQQRTITLLLIMLAFKNDIRFAQTLKPMNLIDWKFTNQISQYNIQNNYNEIVRRLKDFSAQNVYFILNQCEVVVVTLTNITECFQFFDSQNARGRDLEPHDLLKAFHLREMKKIEDNEKTILIEGWEKIDSKELANLFKNYLFRIRNWSKGRKARFFNKSDIDTFKGINLDNHLYSYTNIHHIVNDCINLQNEKNIDNLYYPFQIDQYIINGKRFFEMVHFYKYKLSIWDDNEIIKLLNQYEGRNRIGDKYVRNLFDCALIYYHDKFGDIEIEKAINKIFIWAYTLRLTRQSVQIASMDNYARETKLFITIREAISHKEVINIHIKNIQNPISTKTDKILDKFEELNYV